MGKISDRLNNLLDVQLRDTFEALSLLALRLIFGGLLFLNHGLDKFQGFNEMSAHFPDPLNLGNPTLSLSLAIFGEFICAGLITVGLMTRLAAIPAFINMAVVVFVVHGSDPLQKKEMALLYLGAFLVIVLKGAGPMSLDGLMKKLR